MCGIAGFNWNDKILIRKMTQAISYRGPDDSGIYSTPHISLGHRRLSIIDLSENGKQPMMSKDMKVIITYNGEIWNYKELKESLIKEGYKFKGGSDTEVIIYGYQEYGDKIFSMLDGMFAIALYDRKTKDIYLARDKIGKRPLYYYHGGKDLIFASEIKAILECDKVKREINPQCLSDYLSMRFSTGDETMIRGVLKVPPATVLKFSRGKMTAKKFWDLPELKPDVEPDEKKIDELIENAVKKRLVGDVPIGVLLSGGLDSSAIVSYMSRLGYKTKTFSVGFGDVTDETKYAEMVAKKFGTEHKTLKLDKNILSILPETIWHADEPLADPAILPTYVLCREVSRHVKVAFSGEGGDEVFGGYSDFNFLYELEKIEKTPKILRKISASAAKQAAKLFGYPLKQKMMLMSEILANTDAPRLNHKKLFYLPFDSDEKKAILNEAISEKVQLRDPIDKYVFHEDSPWNNAIRYYFEEWLPNDLLMKADKASLAHGLELRNPFLDYELIEYFSRVDNRHKREREVFRKVISPQLPEEIMRKKKQGFVLPISNWLKEEAVLSKIRPHMENLARRKIFKHDEIMRIMDNPEDFRNDHKIWVLLNFEIWAKMYLDGMSKEEIIL